MPPGGVEREVRVAGKGVSAHDASDKAAPMPSDAVQIDLHVRRECAAAEGDVYRPRGALRIAPGSVEDARRSASLALQREGSGRRRREIWLWRFLLLLRASRTPSRCVCLRVRCSFAR